MNYLKDNKVLLLKYLGVIVSNILIYILVSFYCKNIENNFLIMCVVAIGFNIFIFYYKEKVICKYYLDLLCCVVSGFILNFFIKDDLIYSTILFTLFFANNVIFMKNRKEGKVLSKMFSYLLVLVITVVAMFFNLGVRIYLFK